MSISSKATGLRPGVCTSTTRPSGPYTGQIIYETDTGYLRVWDGSAWDYLSKSQDATTNLPVSDIGAAWTSYTPTVTQGVAITKTITYAKYSQIQKLVVVNVSMPLTSAGTASNGVSVTLPVTAANSQRLGGSFQFYDVSANTSHVGVPFLLTTTSVGFITSASADSYFGGFPAITIANGDYLFATIIYEAA